MTAWTLFWTIVAALAIAPFIPLLIAISVAIIGGALSIALGAVAELCAYIKRLLQ
jgi:hypothetical protein